MTLFTKDWKDELSGKKNPNANCIHSSSLLRGGGASSFDALQWLHLFSSPKETQRSKSPLQPDLRANMPWE